MDASAVLRRMDREIWIITAAADGRRGGLVATFVVRASIVPDAPRLLLGLAKQHHTTGLIELSQHLGAHLIREADLPLVWHFGLQSGRDVDKFEGIETRGGTSGAPLLSTALAALDCRVAAQMDIGDRYVYLADVIEACGPGLEEESPLTVSRLLESATPTQRAELDAQLQRDAAIDAAAIEAWRRRSS